jgi:hypothetical protein
MYYLRHLLGVVPNEIRISSLVIGKNNSVSYETLRHQLWARIHISKAADVGCT